MDIKKSVLQQDVCSLRKKHLHILLAIAVALVTTILFLFLFPARFETNDDTAMANIAYGTNGQYSSHLVFINIIIGCMLKACLEVFPAVPWYTVFHTILIFASFTVFFYLLFKKFGSQSVFPMAILIICFGYQFLSKIQFTKTAGISIVAGFLLLFDAIEDRRSRIAYIIGSGMIIAGSMYRFNVFEMLCIPFFGIGVQLLYYACKERDVKQALRLCILFATILGICFGLKGLNDWIYKNDSQWSSYLEFNALRSNLLDYGFPNYENNHELYESLEISQNDYMLYRGWDIADPERFHIDTMRKLVESKEKRQFSLDLIKGCVKEIPLGLFSYWYIIAPLITLLMCLLFLNKKRVFVLVYVFASFALIQLYLYYKGRYLVDRVDVSLILALTMIMLLYACSEKLLNQRKALVLLTGTLVLTALPKHLEYLDEEPGISNDYLYYLFQTDPEHLYMSTSSGLSSNLFCLWDVYPLGLKSNYVITGGWRTASPLFLEVFDRYNIKNPFRDVVDNPTVYMICNNNIELRTNYIREHYAPNANAYCVRDIHGLCQIYRISSAENPLTWIDRNQIVPADDSIKYEISCYQSENNVSISGYLYAAQNNSFASNIYIGLRMPDGTEESYYTTQSASGFSDDYMNGAFSTFFRTLETPKPGTSVMLYLETEGKVYCIETEIGF